MVEVGGKEGPEGPTEPSRCRLSGTYELHTDWISREVGPKPFQSGQLSSTG